jgi:DNA-binding NarL/FixJ family response regulator
MNETKLPIRVMIIDDHKVIREGLVMLMKSRVGLQVVADTGTCAESLIVAEREQPDIILLDVDLGSECGLDILPELLARAKKCRILALTGIRDPEVHHRAMLLGAMGVVQKEKAYEVLFKAIEKVHDGEIWYDRAKMGSVFSDIRLNGKRTDVDPETAKISSLTPREREVITLISEGMKNKAIGDALFISETTVRHHLTSIFEKLGISSRLELIIYAFSYGLAVLPAKTKPTQKDSANVDRQVSLSRRP